MYGLSNKDNEDCKIGGKMAIELDMAAVMAAWKLIRPYIRHTPLIYSRYLSQMSGASVWLKPETQQPTGSFKIRGALNKIGRFTEGEKSRGIVAASAGNHALGVAYAAKTWGNICTDIFIPATAPLPKVDKLRRFDVTLHQEGQTYEDAHQAAAAFSAQTGGIEISAYDDVAVVAGQATIGLEILIDLPQSDVILVPVGGGGMVAGIVTTAWALNRQCRVIGVQPEASPAALLSLRDGVAYDPYDHEPTLADGLAGGFGQVPFALVRGKLDQVLLATETEMRQAIFTLLDQEQLVVEASGAIAVAPLLNGSLNVAGKSVVCVLSGGNLATAVLQDILGEFISA
jgi:threonine dehydratase